jgi:hypothetical protein
MIWMAQFSPPKLSPHKAQYFRPTALERVTVYELFRKHLPLLSELPGELSQFNQTDIGYEWRCELELGVAPAAKGLDGTGNRLYLHFSLVDLPGQRHPAAVLYLLEQRRESVSHERILLPLEDLSETQEQLNTELSQLAVSIEVYEKAHYFISALSRVKESLDGEVSWS